MNVLIYVVDDMVICGTNILLFMVSLMDWTEIPIFMTNEILRNHV